MGRDDESEVEDDAEAAARAERRRRRKEARAALDPTDVQYLIDRELARRKLFHYVRFMWPVLNPSMPFQDNWHIGCICEHLEALTALQIKRLVINCPPRHGKSLIDAVFWPTWNWIEDPGSQWLFASYDDSLGQRDSDRCRDVIKSPRYRESFGITWKIKYSQDSKEVFRNTMQGSRTITTPEGKATGLDADYQVADDPQNVKEKRSPAKLKQTAEWWTEAMSTRGNDPARLRRLVNMQRIAGSDLTGEIMARELGYEHLVLPHRWEPKRYCLTREQARAEKVKDPIVPTSVQVANPATRDPRTEAGQLLWPERFTEVEVVKLEHELGASATAGQLYQRPAVAKGTVFQNQMFRRFRRSVLDGAEAVTLYGDDADHRTFLLSACRMFQTADTATSKKSTADFTAVGTFMLTPDADLLVWSMWRERLDIGFQLPALQALRRGNVRWLPEQQKFIKLLPWPRPLLFQGVEAKSSGIGLIQAGAAAGTPFKSLKADLGKEERAAPAATLYQSGKVFHMEGAPWLTEFEGELLAFPHGQNDDQFDTVAHAGYLVGQDLILQSYLRGDLVGDDSPVPVAGSSAVVYTTGGPLEMRFDDD